MKKLLFILLGIGLTVGASAQVQSKEIVKKAEEKELRHDIRVKRAHKKAVYHNLVRGRIKRAGKQQDVVNAKRKEVHADTKDLRALGVKHPAHEAKKVIRKQDEPQPMQ